MSDLRLQMLIDQCMPMMSNLDTIKLKTYRKITRHDRHQRLWRRACSLIVVAASVLLIVAALQTRRSPAADVEFSAQTAVSDPVVPPTMITISVPAGERRTIVLPDGTRMVANARSTVTYPATFADSHRDVYVHGEVYLEVAHDVSHPFVLHADGLSLRVLGTRFAFYGYSSDHTSVVLVEGSVEVTTASRDKVTLHPDQQLTVESGVITHLRTVDAAAQLDWTSGVLQLKGETICDLVSRIRNYYDVPIDCQPGLSCRRLYGKLELKSDAFRLLRCLQSLADVRIDQSPDGRISICPTR